MVIVVAIDIRARDAFNDFIIHQTIGVVANQISVEYRDKCRLVDTVLPG